MTESTEGDWRLTVQQSNRNAEVRQISKVLAALEPGATPASKLRLATQFEANVFSVAESFADYRKKLTKRLKKLQKNYVPPPAAQAGPKRVDSKAVLKELRNQYGEDLLYILKNADFAVSEMKARHGEEKATQLKQHTQSVELWATDLGLLPGTEDNINRRISAEQLNKLRGYLERKTENIRAHVVKLADADRFLAETLAKKEIDFANFASQQPSKLLAQCTRRRYEHLYQQVHHTKPIQQPNELLAESLEQAQAAVPMPTRSDAQQRTGLSDAEKYAAMKHLDKMRSASTVCLAYLTVHDKKSIPSTLVKANQIVSEGTAVCVEMLRKIRANASDTKVTLEDAWMKPLVLASRNGADEIDGEENASNRPFSAPAIRSRVLLTPNRKTPSNLIPALRQKRVRLVRPPPIGRGTHLILDFEFFVLTVHLVPLLVTIRAKNKDDQEAHNDEERLRWDPLDTGLVGGMALEVWGVSGSTETLGGVVKERLRDASAQATHVLRQCFQPASKATVDYEIEILEATALLEFVDLARTTFIPDWKDAT